jgi:hypothetical protein
VGFRAGLDIEARGKIPSLLPGIEPRSPVRPARSQILYWLSYPAHLWRTQHLDIYNVAGEHAKQKRKQNKRICEFLCSVPWFP